MSPCYDSEKWLMISLASIAITLTIGLVSLVYGQAVEFKTYTNNDMKFSIQHPSNWKVEDDDDNATQVYFTIRENEKEDVEINEYFSLPASVFNSFFRVSVEEPKSDLDTDTMTVQNTSLKERVQQELDTISSNPSEDTLIRQNEVTVGENTGWKIEYRHTDEHKDRYVFVIFTLADGNFYVLRYVEEPLKVPESLPLANKMVDSFQIKEDDQDKSNNLSFEEFKKKYCPPLSLVLCEGPELE